MFLFRTMGNEDKLKITKHSGDRSQKIINHKKQENKQYNF